MKKDLLKLLAIVTLVGFAISPWNPAWPIVKDWIRSRPEAARAWYDGKVFGFRANKLANCVAERLQWSRVIGVGFEDEKLSVLVHFQPSTVEIEAKDGYTDAVYQVKIVTACSRYIPNWNEISIVNHLLDITIGFGRDAEVNQVFTARISWVLIMDKENAALLLQALDPDMFMFDRISDGNVTFVSFNFFSVPQQLEYMNGEWTVDAIVALRDYQDARNELVTERIRNRPTPVPKPTATSVP